MEIFKNHPQWILVKEICAKLKENGFTAWLAGGCVRDGLLGLVPKDFDVATNAEPQQVEKLFKKTVDVGKSFGVIRVVTEGGGDFEVASFRKDGLYVDGRHPETVELSTPQEDAQRRDFTINALFYDPAENKVHDFVDGLKDLKNRIIKTVGTAEHRFQEDKLRILRAVRFVSQLDFQLEKLTLEAVIKRGADINQVSTERISIEISKLLAGERPDKGVKLLDETGLLKILIPEINFEKSNDEIFKKFVGEPNQELLGWLALFNLIGDAVAEEKVQRRLRFSKEKMTTLKNAMNLSKNFEKFDSLTLGKKRRFAAKKEGPLALRSLELTGQAPPGLKKFLDENSQLPVKFLAASDLMALGLKPGRQLGQLLDEVFEEQLEGKIKTKDEALRWLNSKIK